MPQQHDQANNWDRWADQDVNTYGAKDPKSPAAFLAGYATGGSRALELGPGVGTVAKELAAHGIEVVGIDISPQMVARMTAHCAGLPVTAIVGDMADADIPGPFHLVYATTSTIYSLLTQARQRDCFANVAKVLARAGRFVVDAFVPLKQGAVMHRQNVALRALGEDNVDISATIHDPSTQRITFREVRMSGCEGLSVLPVEIRYIHPSEMDLMAALAGLELLERFGDWDRGAFGPGSTRHISVYG